jgi:hypothetical protein
LELKIHFESKLILIQWLDEKDWIKSMYTEYIHYMFSITIGPHVYDSWNIIKQKEIEKIMQCPSIKSPPLWYGSGFFLKWKYYYAFIAEKMQKNNFFLNGISSKSLNFKNYSRFNYFISISCTIKKFTQKFNRQLHFLNSYSNFQTLWQVLFGHKYTPYIQIFQCLL